MEARFGGKNHVYGPVVTDMKAMGKRTLEWDLNDWNWDGDLFRASPLNPAPSDCRSRQLFPLEPELPANVNASNSSSSCSEEINLTNEKGKRELDKRRRVEVFPEDSNDETGSLNLKLGKQVYPIVDDGGGKQCKVGGIGANHPVCQVEDCRTDLCNAKEYHRRHKVCEMHSKASKALVGNIMQRFCQQCSRFHVLQEFDEGKRSCRRRLAGHNKRRRKTHTETSVNAGPLIDDKSTSYLLISLLRILSNMHMNGSSDQSKDQDLLSHLLRSLAAPVNGSNIAELLRGPQSLLNNGTLDKGTPRTQEPCRSVPSTSTSGGLPTMENQCGVQQTASALQSRVFCPTSNCMPVERTSQEANEQRYMLNDIDLNNVYVDPQEALGDMEKGQASIRCSFSSGQDLQKASPPQTSGNSHSTSGRSSSSGSDGQSRTDRIVLKLFGKDPSDLPQALRTQMLDWLSHSPTDIEGYIRPGCIILTIYLRLNESLWEEFCCDLSSSMSRLLDVSFDPFWKTGWIYTRVQQHAAFLCDGRVVVDTSLPFKNHSSQILSISPLAVPPAETVQWVIRGSNLAQPTSRLLCAIEGKYITEEICHELLEGANTDNEQDNIQSLSFCCSVLDVNGRGFIEVEDYGLTGCFFPFIVAEPEICSEICMLEKVMEIGVTDNSTNDELKTRNQALDFVHEMGWLLHRNHLRLKLGQTNSFWDLFPFERLKWLIEFSMDRDWHAVLRKLLDLVFSGIVDAGEYASIEHALLEMCLLHNAVRKNNRSTVEFLLTYVPKKVENTSEKGQTLAVYGSSGSFLFRPDVAGAGGLTPLHIAASTEGSENVLDALLEDPGLVGIKAWKTVRDSIGLTPSDYANSRGHYNYIKLVQRKINKKSFGGHVVVDIPSPSSFKSNQNQTTKHKSTETNSFYTEKQLQLSSSCKLCHLKPDYSYKRTAFVSKSAVFSLVAIATVCVCAALLFKSLPQVDYVFRPFRWELLKYGPM